MSYLTTWLDAFPLEALQFVQRNQFEGGDDRGMDLSTYYRDALRMAEREDDPAVFNRLASIQTPRSLITLHNRLCDRVNQGLVGAWSYPKWPCNIPSPLSPLPSWLIPMDTHAAVAEEGQFMDHCVVSYSPSVPRGNCYIYRVDHPLGRATLAIQRSCSERNPWIVNQLAEVRNRPVEQKIHSAIGKWLADVQKTNPNR